MNATQNIANSARIYCAVASTGQALARAAGCGYTLRISKGIRVLQPGAIRGIKPQLPQPCGFFVGAPFFGGADGNPQGLSVFAPRVARSANLSALPPRFCSLVGSCFKSNLEPIMTNTLIPVFTGNLSNAPVQLCDARTLHAFMQVKRDFSNWIKGRIRKFGFEVGLDYLVAKSGEQLPSGTKHVIDYHLTLDMAKELSMVENNDMGKQARRYFIECEKAVTQQPLALPAPGLTKAQQQQLKAAVQASCGADGKAYSACYGALYAAFQVPRYQDIAPDQFDAAMAFVRGFNAKPALPAPDRLQHL